MAYANYRYKGHNYLVQSTANTSFRWPGSPILDRRHPPILLLGPLA